MPLAAQGSDIAGLLKYLAQRHHVLPQVLLAESRIQPGQNRSTRRRAFSIVVKLRESHPLTGQAVEVRRHDLPAIATDIRKTHVIAQDEHNVRSRSGLRRQGTDRRQE